MSAFLSTSSPNAGVLLHRNDLRLGGMQLQQPFAELVDIDFIAPGSFESEWWPSGGLTGDAGDVGLLQAVHWGYFDQSAGASSSYGFTGTTRDSNGTAIGSCTVICYRTSDNALISTTTSDSNGLFRLPTPYYPDAHYLVAHKTASPDVDGATRNTLIGV